MISIDLSCWLSGDVACSTFELICVYFLSETTRFASLFEHFNTNSTQARRCYGFLLLSSKLLSLPLRGCPFREVEYISVDFLFRRRRNCAFSSYCNFSKSTTFLMLTPSCWTQFGWAIGANLEYSVRDKWLPSDDHEIFTVPLPSYLPVASGVRSQPDLFSSPMHHWAFHCTTPSDICIQELGTTYVL